MSLATGETCDNIPDDPVRYGSGVPTALRSSDLEYIAMTGISRRTHLRDMMNDAATEEFTHGLPAYSGPMHADAEFRMLIEELTESPLGGNSPARPPGAAQALAEAEQLLQALDLPNAPATGHP